jgi:hypothetical protein
LPETPTFSSPLFFNPSHMCTANALIILMCPLGKGQTPFIQPVKALGRCD